MTVLPLVGRDDELDAIGDAWKRLAADPARAHIAAITGAAGAGKSRLVAEAVDRLDPAPAVVLTGQARIHSPAPYDWLASALSGHPGTGLPVPADALAWLTQRPDLPPRRFSPGALLRAAVDTVRAVLGPGPGVLVVEDLHQLDPASLDLVSELAAAPRLPALLLITSRASNEATFPDLAARVLARVSGTPRSVRRHLAPLPPAGVAAVLAAAFGSAASPEVVAAAHRRTGGNPFVLAELITAYRGAGLTAFTEAPLPDHLAALVPDRPAGGTAVPAGVQLTAREREVLDCLATGMSNQQVARALGISVRTVTVHVSNLLRKTGAGSRTEAALWALRHGQVTRVSRGQSPR